MAVQVLEQKNADQEGTTVYYQQQYQTQDMNQNTSDRYHGREFEKYSRDVKMYRTNNTLRDSTGVFR